MSANPAFDTALLRRYDARRSACTGYPVNAARLSSGFGPAALRDAARVSNGDPIPPRLCLHLHLASASGNCRACGLRGVDADELGDAEADLPRLQREIALAAALFDADREVVQVQFTGVQAAGAALPAQAALLACLGRSFQLAATVDIEAVLDLVPGPSSPVDLRAVAACGFNRIRLRGADPAVLAAALEDWQRCGLRGMDVDLLYGSARGERATVPALQALLQSRPDRIGLFPAGQPADLEALKHVGDALSTAGYVYLGMDQFALPDDHLALAQARRGLHANLLGYTPWGETEVVGLGVGALSRIGDSLTLNCRSTAAWRIAVEADRLPVGRGLRLTEEDELRAHIIQSLACEAQVPIRMLEQRYGIDFRQKYAAPLQRLAPLLAEDLATLAPDRLRVSAQGRQLLGHIAACFDQK